MDPPYFLPDFDFDDEFAISPFTFPSSPVIGSVERSLTGQSSQSTGTADADAPASFTVTEFSGPPSSRLSAVLTPISEDHTGDPNVLVQAAAPTVQPSLQASHATGAADEDQQFVTALSKKSREIRRTINKDERHAETERLPQSAATNVPDGLVPGDVAQESLNPNAQRGTMGPPLKPGEEIGPAKPSSHQSSSYLSSSPPSSMTMSPTCMRPLDDGLPRPSLSRRTSNAHRQPRTFPFQAPSAVEGVQLSPERLAVPSQSKRRPSQSSTRLSIRDTSRSRSNSNAGSSAGRRNGELCADCEIAHPHTDYCNICRRVFCEQCWERQVTHKPQKRDDAEPLHVKTDHSMAKKIRAVFDSKLTEQAREQLHERDIDSAWFGVVREEHELPLIRDYGRYATLIARLKDMRLDLPPTASATTDQSDTLYPSLVSFVGETGAGKSTLIRLLIDLKLEQGDPKFPTPVVGAPGKDVSTSEDVHLYLDPDSSLSPNSQTPLLFADCEGLNGGERDPVAARLKKKLAAASAGGGRRRPRLKHTSERELVWAESPAMKTRGYAVKHLYPRLLYTFSDVIVYVLKNPRVIEDVLEKLIIWAQAALEKSSNQPVLPHAIIVFNASESNLPADYWNVNHATADLMESLSRTVFQNQTFSKYADFWRGRDRRVETVEQLLRSYYSDIRVVWIPTGTDPKLIQGQVHKLSTEIQEACKTARDKKADLRMLLDADELQPYLQVAFDHFAQNLNDPFDFVQASFTNSPIPNTFGGNILKLAIQVMDKYQGLINGPSIFKELSYVVASCIMLDVARHKYRGKPSEIFPRYLGHIDTALENFCDRYWPCEFSTGPNERCVNVRSGHGAKGHQLKTGKLLAAGDYQSSFTFASYKQVFQDHIYERLEALSHRVRQRTKEDVTEDRAAAEIHRESVLHHFFTRVFKGDSQSFISHSVCFVCLFEAPEHALPCGHIICTSCLRTYGRTILNRYVDIVECPLEEKERRFVSTWRVHLKPENCGVRVLTLDGGGIRGVVELEILKSIERALGGHINIRHFFDLIVGTSTGGIIALGLTARGWTVEKCSEQFETLCKKAFVARKGTNVPVLSWLVESYNHSKYETQPLQEALIKTFGEKNYLFGGPREDNERMDVKVAVTATSTSLSAVLLANYNRHCTEKLSYHFQRPEKLEAELLTWEAARATSAAPTYFKPLCHEGSKQVFADGGVYNNNPIFVADQERKLIWPSHGASEPDIMVSLGTVSSSDKKQKRAIPFTSSSRGVVSYGRNMYRLMSDHVKMSLASENVWNDYLRFKQPSRENRGRYVRINPVFAEVPRLDEVDKMGTVKQATRHYLETHQQEIESLAKRLVATCFYFDPSGPVQEDAHVEAYDVSGYFQCRLMAGSPEIGALGHLIKSKATAKHDPVFLISEEGNEDIVAQEVRLDNRVLNRMIESCRFRIDDHVRIRHFGKHTKTEISLCFTKGTAYPISGFPRQLHCGEVGSHPANRFVVTNSVRWAARTPSQQLQRRQDWAPPNKPTSSLEEKDIIERYAESNHLLDTSSVHEYYRDQTVADMEETSELPAHPSPVELASQEVQHVSYQVAVSDWKPPNQDRRYLRLTKDDSVRIQNRSNDDWCWGQLTADPRRRGWMPFALLRPAYPGISTSEMRSELDGTSSRFELPVGRPRLTLQTDT